MSPQVLTPYLTILDIQTIFFIINLQYKSCHWTCYNFINELWNINLGLSSTIVYVQLNSALVMSTHVTYQ